jgi:hypothetical protein
VDVYLQGFLTLALYGGECSVSRSGRFIPGENLMYPLDPGHCTEVGNCILHIFMLCAAVLWYCDSLMTLHVARQRINEGKVESYAA